jgi:hypothetical protein
MNRQLNQLNKLVEEKKGYFTTFDIKDNKVKLTIEFTKPITYEEIDLMVRGITTGYKNV